MKMKWNKWLLLLAGIVLVIILAKSMYTPANILLSQFHIGPFIVVGPGEVAYTGDTFEHTFTVTNRDSMNYPADYDSNGDGVIDTHIDVFYGWNIVDPNKVVVAGGCSTPDGTCEFIGGIPMNASETKDVTVSMTVTNNHMSGDPANDRYYGASIILYKIVQTWDRSSNQWSTDSAIIDAACIDPPTCSVTNPSLAVKFDVKTQRPYESLTQDIISSFFKALFTNLWAWLKSWFAWI